MLGSLCRGARDASGKARSWKDNRCMNRRGLRTPHAKHVHACACMALQVGMEASRKDDQLDENKDGIADVKQIDTKEVSEGPTVKPATRFRHPSFCREDLPACTHLCVLLHGGVTSTCDLASCALLQL